MHRNSIIFHNNLIGPQSIIQAALNLSLRKGDDKIETINQKLYDHVYCVPNVVDVKLVLSPQSMALTSNMNRNNRKIMT